MYRGLYMDVEVQKKIRKLNEYYEQVKNSGDDTEETVSILKEICEGYNKIVQNNYNSLGQVVPRGFSKEEEDSLRGIETRYEEAKVESNTSEAAEKLRVAIAGLIGLLTRGIGK